ncbi:MAG: LPS export ABC transporter permease LptG [Desulfosudaceae bacterium]
MSILFRYIFREIFKTLAIVAIVVITIYLVVDFFEKIDNFMNADLPLSSTLSFFVLKIPLIVMQVAPVAILIATLVVFGLMNKHNEIIAIRSSGLGTRSLLVPAVFAAACVCFLVFILSELVIPVTMTQANHIWLKQVRQKTSALRKQNDIWIKDGRIILHIDHYDPTSQTAYGVTLNHLGEDFKVSRRVDARRGVFRDKTWILKTAMDHHFDESGRISRADITADLPVNLTIMPEDLGRAAKSTEEMRFMELRRHIKKLKKEGYNVKKHATDLQAKLSFPLVGLLMSLIGTGLAASGKVKGGIPATIAYGIGASFAYWIFHSFCMSLGYGGVLPPVIAAWAANIVFMLAAGLVILKAD